MKDYVILSDSCCDLDKKMREKYHIDYEHMYITYNDIQEKADLDWQELSEKEFYNKLRKGVVIKTSQVSMEAYEKTFENYISKGLDILYVSCSSALSGSINASLVARDFVLKKHPGAKIVCIDSLNSSLGLGKILIDASNLKSEGKTIEEVAGYIESERLCYWQVGSCESLKYLKRAGRVTGTAALMGDLFNIKPIVVSDSLGQNVSIEKIKGRKKSIQRCIEIAKENIVDAENQTVFLSHADCAEEAEQIKIQILEELKCKDVYINGVGPILGASCGPGMFAIYFKGKKVTV